MRGVIREDDVGQEEFVEEPIPDPDPYGDVTRVFGHFYDPINNDGIPDIPLVNNEQRVKSINWALGLDDALALSFNPLLSRRNHFSWLDARRAYFKALTYQTSSATQTVDIDEEESKIRLFFMATTVKALGQVIHVLQDGAQPQHSRLDAHNHSNSPFLALLNKDLPRRLMEVYTNIRVTRDPTLVAKEDVEPLRKMFTDDNGNVELPPPVPVGNYPIPTFSTPRRFLTTRNQSGSDPINDRKGIFDYSNRGFFTDGTANGDANLKLRVMPSPPPNNAGASTIVVNDGDKTFRDLAWNAPDEVSPSYVDALDAVYAGKVPLGKRNLLGGISGRPPKVKIDSRHLRNHANVLIPRAIAYSTGLINYFFRGTLEIEPIEQKLFGIVNQGEAHTVDANGWPRKSGGAVFGFEKVRLKVRNITTPITEPGVGGAVVPQTVGTDGQLIAIARYHRNLCYQPNLSGERTQTFATPPLVVGTITEPTCAAGATRSVFQDISVSVPIAISNITQLPGGSGAPLPASVETAFNFSIDPIPVNATDLIIQVVYRGTLGEEPESMALGSIDVREPIIVTFWNNSDYFYDATTPPWRIFNTNYPLRPIQYFRFCFGPGTAERLGYWYVQPLASGAMLGNDQTRFAVIPAPPTSPTDTFRVKGTPITSAGVAVTGSMRPLTRSGVGRIAQANREFISTATQAAPSATCNSTLPTSSEFWCNDPLQRRRSILLGSVLQPLAWVSINAAGFNTADVAEFMTAASGTVQPLGENRYNDDADLPTCPAPPAAVNLTDEELRLQELEALARSFGVRL